jgi:preprotein translocase subunit SecB
MTNTTPPPSSPAGPTFSVRGQYIRDLSFENPHAPHSLMVNTQKPAIDVNVDLRAQKIQDNLFEMIMKIAAKASVQEGTLFVVDLEYAGIFELSGFPEDRIESTIMVDCPFVLFPFARRVVADVTRDGGFPPLMLDPIDFHTLYVRNKTKAG